MLWLLKESARAKIRLRTDKLKDLDDAIKLYTDITKGWLVATIRRPVLSIVSEPGDIDFDFRDMKVDEAVREGRLMRLKVRVKGVLQDIAMSLEQKRAP